MRLAGNTTTTRKFLRQMGDEKLLWASDCPFAGFEGKVTYREMIDDILAWLPAASHRRVFGENALKLYFS